MSLKSGVFYFLERLFLNPVYLLSLVMLLAFGGNLMGATIKSTATGGNWSNETTWVGGVVPVNGDDVSIPAGSMVTIDTNPTVGSLSVFGTLQFEVTTARSITVLTQVSVNSGGVFQSAQSGTVKNHQLFVEGSIINDGILDFSSNSNASGVEIVFTGSNNAIFNCSDAPLTNLKQTNGITLDKGKSAASVLSFTPGNSFQVLSDGSSNAKGFLTIINGTFNIIGANNFNNPVFNTEGSYTIPATGGFWLGNQNATVIGMDGIVTNLGDLKITNGTYSVGISGKNSSGIINYGQFKISGGNLNIAGKFTSEEGESSISGGKINLATKGSTADRKPTFSISPQTSLQIYGNPFISIEDPNSDNDPFNDIQILKGSGKKLIKGGIFQMGTAKTPEASTFFVNSEIPIYKITPFDECSIRIVDTSNDLSKNLKNGFVPKSDFDKHMLELSAPENKTVICNGEIPAPYATLQAFMSDGGKAIRNCTLISSGFKLLEETQSGANCPYTITRTYQVTDIFGNIGTAKHLIFVEGETAEPDKEEVLRLKSAMVSYTAISGNWSDPATWGGTVPTVLDDVTIPNGVTVTIDAAAVCNDITIQAGGTVNSGGAFALQVNGDWTNNGTYGGGTNGIIEFKGTGPAAIYGTTNFEELIINKGSLVTTLTIDGTVSVLSSGKLTLTSGLVTIPAGSSFTVNPASALSIPSIAGFDVNGGNLTTGNFTISNRGWIRISSGTANFGTISGNSVETLVDGVFQVSGTSVVNIAGRLENSAGGNLSGIPSGINISGGTITLATQGNGLDNVGSLNVVTNGAFNFTGGTIIFQSESSAGPAIDLGLVSGTGNGAKTTVGGTFQFGNASTPVGTVFNISSNIPLDKVTSSANADIKLAGDVTIGQLVLNPGTTIDLNGSTLQMSVFSTGAYNFPLDNGSGVSIPLTVHLTGGTLAPGAYISIETTGTDHPNNASATNYLNRYWTVTTSGITSPVYNVTATYADGDIAGTETEIAMGSYVGGSSPWVKYGNANAAANTLSATGIAATSFVFAGITSDPPTVTITATNSSICIGASTTLTANPVGDPTFTYIWASIPAGFTSTLQSVSATPLVNTTYTVIVTDGNGITATNNIAITVAPNNTVTAASSTPTPCINTPMTAITHTTTGANGIGAATGLPAGVNAAWASNTITISGTPTASGTFNYSIPLIGGCGTVNATGTIIVSPNNTVSAASSTPTLCINTALTAITHTTTGATGIGAPTGLPTGVTASWAPNTITISGTPTVSGTFIYSIPLNGGCGVVSANGTITVTPPITASAAISNPILCFGGTANILISASGGTTPYTFNFQGKPSNATGIFSGVTGSVAGTNYTWSVTDANGCAAFNGSITVTQPAQLTANAAITSAINCNGGSAVVTITASGGTTPLSYTFNGVPDTDGIINNVTAGNYNWSVTDANGCTPITGNITITQPTPLSITSATVTTPIACNGGTGVVTIVAAGGTGVRSYTFNGQTNTTGVFANVYAGTNLSYSVTDANNCGPVFGTLTVTQPTAITASAAVTTPILCNGGTAIVTITAAGGTGALSYTFNGNTNATGIFTGIAPGTNLAWSVKDANNCGPVSGTLNITQPTALSASVSESVSIVCFGGTASIQITASGGTGAKQYTFNGVTNATGTFTGIAGAVGAGASYNWSVTDGNSCSVSGTYNVVQPSQIVITSIGSNSAICAGATLNLTSVATGGTGTLRYNWTGPNGFTANNAQNPSLPAATAAASGTYTLTVTDANNCTAVRTTTVTVYATPTMTDPANQSVCHNASTAAVNFTGATSYAWTNNTPSIGLAASGTGNIPAFTATNTTNATVTATITVTPTANGCTGTPQTFTIAVNPKPIATVTPGTAVFCHDGTVNIVFGSNIPGTTFTWSVVLNNVNNNGPDSGTGSSVAQNLEMTAPWTSPTAVYTGIPTSPAGCVGDPVSATIEIAPWIVDGPFTVTGRADNATVCPGDNVAYNLTGQNGGNYRVRFTYEVDNPNVGLVDMPGSYFGTGNGDGNPVSGTVSFNATNSTNTPQTARIIFTAVTYWEGSMVKICEMRSISRTITVSPFAIACPSNIVTTTDASQCYATLTPAAAILSCGTGAALTWTMTGATIASGNNNIGSRAFNVGTTTVTYTATKTGPITRTCSFTVTVTDNQPPVISGCPGNTSTTTTTGQCGAVVTWGTVTATDNCGGSATLTRTDGTGLNSGSVFPVGVTTIKYLATDAAGNTSSCSFTVTVAPDAQAPVVICVGNQAVCAPAGSPYTKLGADWDATATDNCPGAITKTYVLTGATTGSGTSLNNVQFNVGTTTVTWTARDINNNPATCAFNVVVNQSPAITTNPVSQSICLNGSVTLTVVATGTPGPTYQWRKGGVNISGATGAAYTINPVLAGDAGSYDVIATNSCGNVTSAPAVLSVSTPPVITVQPANQTDCFGGSVEFSVTVTGGIPNYTYAWEKRILTTDPWSATGSNSNLLTVSTIGDAASPNQTQYRVTVTDNCGNSATSTIATLTVNKMELQSLVTTSVCQGGNTNFTVATSGTTPVSYEWQLNGITISNGGAYSGAGTQTLIINNIQVAQAGDYTARAVFNITQPNNNGAGVTTCQPAFIAVGKLIVDLGPDIVASPATQTICPGSAIAEIALSNANGTPGTTYSWTRNNTAVLTGMPASGTGATINGTLTSLDPANTQTTTFTITATASSCVSTKQVTVIVVDNTPPTVATCPANMPVNSDAGICGAVVNYTAPTFNDNCDGSGLSGTLVAGLASGSQFPIGTTTVTYRYTDIAGNSPASCSFVVTVTDHVAPIALCKNITVQLDAAGNASITAADLDNGSTDNCGTPALAVSKTTFNCTNLGANTVVLTVTDGAGNTATCSSIVTVSDTTNPVAINATLAQTTINCFGGTAQVTITATGGVGTLSYTFNGVTNATGIFTNIPAGTGYSWSVTNPLACGNVNGTFDVIQPAKLSATIASTDVTCSSNNDGTITISNPQGGSGSYEYTNNGGTTWQSGLTFVGLAPATYNVQIRDANATSCVVVLNAAVVVYTLSADLASTNVTCVGATDGTITISNPHGGSNSFEYSIDGGSTWQITGTYSGLVPDTYNVQIRDKNNITCVLIIDAALVITQPAVLAATINSTNITCFGATDGTITASAPTGGYGTYEVSINGTNWFAITSATPYTFTGLAPASYIVQIRDAAHVLCIQNLPSLSLTAPVVLSATVSSTNVSCNGLADGTISITAPAGGSGAYQYSVDGGTSWYPTGNFATIAAGFYNVLIRDAAATACVITLNSAYEITQPAAMSITAQPTDINACKGNTVVFSATVSGSVGTVTYVWQRKRPAESVFTTLPVAEPNVTYPVPGQIQIVNIGTVGSPTGTKYQVIVTDNCSSITSGTATLTVNEITGVTPAVLSSTVCPGSTFEFEVTTVGSTPTYQWQKFDGTNWNDVANSAVISGATTSKLTFTGVTVTESGRYAVVVTFPGTNGNCAIDSRLIERNLAVSPAPTVTNPPANATYCSGTSVIAYPLTGTPANVRFDISGGAAVGLTDRTNIPLNTIPLFIAQIAGIVPVTATITITPHANGCYGTPATYTITVNPVPNISVSPIKQTICSGGTTNIALSPNVSGALLSWTTIVTPAGSVTGVSDATNVTVSKLEQALVNTTTGTITVDYIISANSGYCTGASTTVTITVLPRIDLIITNPPTVCSPLTVDLTTSTVTTGSTAGLVYTYWTDAAATIALANPAAVGNGTYYIKGTRTTTNPNNTCFEIGTVTVTVAPTPTLVINQPAPVCSGNFVNITAPSITAGSTASLTYSYWLDAGATETYTTPATAGDGTYYIKGTTAAGCFDIKPVTVVVYTNVSTPVFAKGPTSQTCKGSAPITYTASAQNALSIEYSIDAASEALGNSVNSAGQVTFATDFAGTIYLTAKAIGCTANSTALHTITVNAPPIVTLVATAPTTICEGQGVVLTATSSGSSVNDTYTASSGNIGVDIPNNSRTAYTYSTITPVNITGTTATLTAADIVIVTLDITHDYDEDLDIFLVDPSGTRAMLLSSDNGGSGDNYSATVFRTDATNSIIGQSAAFNGTFKPEGAIDVAPDRTGASGNNNYDNSVVPGNNLTGATINGAWSLRIFDDSRRYNNGTGTSNTVGELTNWSLTIIRQVATGYTTVFNDNGIPGISIANTGTASTTVSPSAGTHIYTATTTDANGCVATSSSVTVTVRETPKPRILADYCAAPGNVRLTAVGGASGASYVWRNSHGDQVGTNTSTISVNLVDRYSVRITNLNGCSADGFLDVANELAINGDFEMGPAGVGTFNTDYVPDNTITGDGFMGEGVYGIGTDARDFYTAFRGAYDHTIKDGTGYFYVVDGTGSDAIVWEQTYTVQDSTNYYFSAWALNIYLDETYGGTMNPHLQFEINGTLFGTDVLLNEWTDNNNNPWLDKFRFYGTWNSGAATTAVVRIRNLISGLQRNDFGLDDISFGTFDPFPVKINVTAADVCEGGTIQLYSNIQDGLEPITYNWTGPNGFVSNLQNPVIPDAKAINQGTYTLTATDGYGCPITPDQKYVTVFAAPIVNAGSDQTVCTANPVVVLSGSVSSTATSGTWTNTSGDGVFANPNALSTTYTLGPNEVLAGIATLTLTSDDPVGSCGPVADDLIITIFNSLEITASSVTPLCYDGADGTATAAISKGSSPPYNYLWSNGQITATAIGLTAGTYTVVVTDANGCTASATVEVTQPEPFFIDAIPHITPLTCYGANDGTATIIASGGTEPYSFLWSGITGSTNTSTVTGLAPGVYNVFVSDANGCTATNIQVIIPMPDPPMLACPPNATDVISGNGCEMIVHTIQDPVIENFCTYTLSYVLTGATTGTGTEPVNTVSFHTGITFVEYTVTDVSGNTMSCTFEVEVKDFNPPVFTDGCPLQNLGPFNADAGLCNVFVNVPVPDASDPCGEGFSIVNDFNGTGDASGIYPLGTTTITWTITDDSGNSTTCTQTVTVVDATKPSITCPTVAPETAGLNNCSKNLAQISNPVINDDCTPVGSLVLTWEMTGATTGTGTGTVTGKNFNVGLTTVTYTVTDSGTNTQTCEFTVTILAVTPPGISVGCADVTDTVSGNNCSIIPGSIASPTLTDNCYATSSLTLTYAMTGATTGSGNGSVVGKPFNVGVTTVIYTVTDPDGLSSSCTFTVTIHAVTPPGISIGCADITDTVSGNGCSMAPGAILSPTLTDNCWATSSLTLTYDMTGTTTSTGTGSVVGKTFNVGVTTVTYTVTNPDGLSSSCTFTVTIIPFNPPVFTAGCPADPPSASATAGNCTAYVSVDVPNVSDPCSVGYSVTNSFNGTGDASGNYPIGVTTVIWTITPTIGAITACTQTVTVIDANILGITCPASITTNAKDGLNYASPVAVGVPTVQPNCYNPQLSWVMVPPVDNTVTPTIDYATMYTAAELAGTGIFVGTGTYYVGVTTITYTFTDTNGTTAACSFTVTVTAAPVIDCQDDILANTDTGTCTYDENDPAKLTPTLIRGAEPITWTWIMTGATTASGSGNPFVPIPYTFNLGTTLITWTATNNSGSATCSHTVTVTDNIAPTFTANGPFEFCVSSIISATYNGLTGINAGISEPLPDWYIVQSTELDVPNSFTDNCCTSGFTVRWKITNSDGSDLPAPLNQVIIGQPSEYIGLGNEIKLLGAANADVVYDITYTVTDCNGKASAPITKKITIKPRPDIDKIP